MKKYIKNLINYYKLKKHRLASEFIFFDDTQPKVISDILDYKEKEKSINRILDFYSKCDFLYENIKVPKELEIGGTWKRYIQTIKKEQINVLARKNVKEILIFHENMFYNCLIKGFMPYSYFENVKKDYAAILNFLKDLDLYDIMFKNFDSLPVKNDIKKWGFKKKNNKIHFGAASSMFAKNLILEASKLLKKKENINILEIGSGYGALAERLFDVKEINSLILTDLPSSLTTAYYYLSAKYGVEKVKIIATKEEIHKHLSLKDKKIILIPTCFYEEIKNFQDLDLLCNFASFSEMDFATIKFYLTNIPKDVKLIVSSNNNEETFRQNHHEVISDKFPIDKEFNQVFSSIRLPFFSNWRYKTCVWYKEKY